ncbi:hypothetical protein IQ238_11835 [Pleurocapsales cyanobacterium LEGE 06147]|nr:hypothetical protein [Pleurocapsales cyanobacterium LEGE 06147]
MVLNQLKKIRDELKESAKAYDEAFKNTAIIATEELINRQKLHDNTQQVSSKVLAKSLDKGYFIKKYGSLQKTKEEYKKIYGQKNYGRSWKDFLKVAKELPLIEQPIFTLEQRIERIENILRTMGYEL